MSFEVHLDGPDPLVVQVYRQVRAAILDGRLRPGERLPPTRELARATELSRNTVATAYERLLAEGFVATRVGSGTYVEETIARPAPARPGGSLRPRRAWTPASPSGAAPRYDLRAGAPDPALFPLASWRRLMNRELRLRTLTDARRTGPGGDPALRAAVAHRLGMSRSVRAAADDVIVTSGAQQAFDLIGRVLLAPGDVVAVEDPGYPQARRLFEALGAVPAPVPVDGRGLVVDALPAGARLVYTTPSHQFPTGVTMSLSRRRELLAWAGRHDAAIVEDDYDSEFRFEDRPLEPLHSLDRAGRVIHVGSFSKTMLPALRLGFLIAPAGLRAALLAAREVTVQHGDPCAEAALAAFLEEGLFARHLRTVTRAYAVRRALLLDALHGELSRWLVPLPSIAGLHLTAHLRPGVRDGAATVVERAARAGVALQTLAQFHRGPAGPDGLVIGFGSVPTDRLPEALRLLAGCFAEG
ncbi:GntR family transcriptional regulator [Actinoplanes philippinensis]|uniref:GntR family transcriptional regulator / MocR family aminotransferase n=1 Tax=Actinoplanes philippinensis TaxID=35752 RepID=A0A1I2GT96_9ACTN|nr:PLP-dependent aminotransferase family protein [Actinoplanes philippinensis]GIE78082.1 GntR family transcriptional regulator [Actinoplanes philippinensis]SFF20702.1 GntR family transcriptional regulator / MocR family aminotransferase [Actinoplanes philippinensis]